MAEVHLDLDFSAMFRAGMIEGLVDLVNASPQYRMAVILRLLHEDPITRCMIAEELGEQALKEKAADDAAQAELARTDFQSDKPADKSWDEIMLEVLERLKDTPGGRGEA